MTKEMKEFYKIVEEMNPLRKEEIEVLLEDNLGLFTIKSRKSIEKMESSLKSLRFVKDNSKKLFNKDLNNRTAVKALLEYQDRVVTSGIKGRLSSYMKLNDAHTGKKDLDKIESCIDFEICTDIIEKLKEVSSKRIQTMLINYDDSTSLSKSEAIFLLLCDKYNQFKVVNMYNYTLLENNLLKNTCEVNALCLSENELNFAVLAAI